MSTYEPLRVAVVGCGGISGPYGASLKTKPEKVQILGAYDQDTDRSKRWAEQFGGVAYPSLEAVLSDNKVEAVVNLTIHHAHAEVNAAALNAGKHVHVEKPLATNRQDGIKTVELAEKKGLRLSASPFTFLGEAQQSFLKALREGAIGKPQIVYSEMNWGRIESWHPNASAFFTKGVGPILDVGVYALTLITSAFGSVKRVRGMGRIQEPDRVLKAGTNAGKSFKVETPDIVIGGLEFESDVFGRITSSFLVGGSKQASGTEVHGTDGALFIGSNHDFHTTVEIQKGGKWESLPYVVQPFPGVEWGRAVFDLADSLRTGSPQRATGKQALHVLDICLSVLESIDSGRPVDVATRFEIPAPLYG